MKINKSTRIIGNKTTLVPYKIHHVLRYHEWMKSKELQQLTASEPLTLDEEYKMQRSWLEDEDKCTFIILNKSIFEKNMNELDAMLGDTNLFLNNPDNKNYAEIEIMIAEKENRCKGYGWEAVILMLQYGIEILNIQTFCAKISMDNTKSINMFYKLGFVEVSKSDLFKEVTLEKNVDKVWIDWLISEVPERIRDESYQQV